MSETLSALTECKFDVCVCVCVVGHNSFTYMGGVVCMCVCVVGHNSFTYMGGVVCGGVVVGHNASSHT